MAESWNTWYPHHIDIWQGSAGIQILSDTAYRAVHNILQDMWKSQDCAIEEKKLRASSRVRDWEFCEKEVLDYFDRTEDGRITHFVQREKWLKAKAIYETNRVEWNDTREARSAAGKAGARARWQNHGKAIAKPCEPDGKVLANDGLTETVTTTKKVQRPSRDKREVDPRHVAFKEEIERYMTQKKASFVWDASEAKQLDLLLKAVPGLVIADFQRCLFHRARSPGVPHGERPRVWLPNILKYQEAPLNEFGKTGATNGNRNHSKTAGNLDAANTAFAILEEAERNSSAADEVQPAKGSAAECGELSDLRAGSIELRPG